MQKSLLFLFTYILLVNANEDYFSNRILFCLAQDHSPLKISFLNNTPVTDNKDINSILSEYDVVDLKKWLHTADENLIDGDIRLSNIYRLQFGKNKSYTELADIIIKLRSLNNIVIDARLEEKYHLTYQTKRHLPNDLRYNEQWALRKIGADYAWGLWDFRRNSVQDSSILIGLVDTGCDYDHPDLDEALFINFGEDINHDGKITTIDINGIDDDKNGFIDDFRGWDFAGNNTSSAGDNNIKPSLSDAENVLSHGTFCAGLIAADQNNTGITGISNNAEIIITKHIHDDYAAQPYLENVIDGIIYCADMGADIINCSFSGPLYNPFSQAAINAVVNKYDCIIVCAAGNDNWNNDNIPQYPADYKNTLSVAALTNFDEKAGYSNYGNSVDISAPGGEGNSSGTGIISTVDSRLNEYDTWYGTSMATAMVTGSFALLEEWFPNKSSNWYIEQILNHSDNIDVQNPGFEGELGHGRVNVYTAIARNLFPSLTIDTSFYEIIDDNGNNELNPGESANLHIALHNDSLWMAALNTNVTISSASRYITFSDDKAEYGDIPGSGKTENVTDNLSFTIPEETPLEPIDIIMEIRANMLSDYPYKKTDTIRVQPKLNQAGFPIVKIPNIYVPLACDSLFGTEEKYVIAQGDNDSLYVYNNDGTILSGFPVFTGQVSCAPVITDMNVNGQNEIIIITQTGHLMLFNNTGAIIYEKNFNLPVLGNIAVANMDADLDMEIIFGSSDGSLFVVNMDGTDVPGFPLLFNSPIEKGVAAGDITGDHIPEIVFGFSEKAEICAITAEGDTVNNFPVKITNPINSVPVILKTDKSYDVLVTTTNNELIRIKADGTSESLFSSHESVNPGLSICDIDKDNIPEIFLGTAGGRLYAFHSGGDTLPDFPVELDRKISYPPVFADFNNDDEVEIVIGDGSGSLYILTSQGKNYPNSPAVFDSGLTSSPVINDLDNDGDLEIMIGTNEGLHVLDMSGNKSKKNYWNTYLSSNLRNNYYISPSVEKPTSLPEKQPVSKNILQNFPNPFNPTTTIEYNLPEHSKVTLGVYNILGQHIRNLYQGNQSGGIHRVVWDGTDSNGRRVVSGVYFYKLSYETEKGRFFSQIRKMLLVR